jgi:hypothetical protein
MYAMRINSSVATPGCVLERDEAMRLIVPTYGDPVSQPPRLRAGARRHVLRWFHGWCHILSCFHDLMWARRIVAIVMLAVGGVWIAQGSGALGGSFMTGDVVWTVIGVIVGLFGLALLIGTARDTKRASRDRAE